MHEIITRSIEALPYLVNSDHRLVRRGRFFHKTFLLQVDAIDHYVTVDHGRIEDIFSGKELLRPWSFAIKGSEQAWRRHWEPHPKPGWHDIFAMAKSGQASIDGELQPLMANLRFIKDVLAKPRILQLER